MNYTHFTAKEIEIQRGQATYPRLHCPGGTQTQVFWLFPLQTDSDIVLYMALVILLKESVFDSIKRDTGRMQPGGYAVKWVAESIAYPFL